MIKLTLSRDRGTVLLNPDHILSITEGNPKSVVVRMVQGFSYEVRESLQAIENQINPKGNAPHGSENC